MELTRIFVHGTNERAGQSTFKLFQELYNNICPIDQFMILKINPEQNLYAIYKLH